MVKDRYNIKSIGFKPGDIVIDVGANVGIVSIFIAKLFPYIHIYSFEPIPDNYHHFIENILANNITNITPFPFAVTADGRDFEMVVNFANNSGGATGYLHDMRISDHAHFLAKSITLDSIFYDLSIGKCKLLKIDCEGAEHEILLNSTYLDRIEYLSGEFHINQNLIDNGYSINRLMRYCRKYIYRSKLKITKLKMAE